MSATAALAAMAAGAIGAVVRYVLAARWAERRPSAPRDGVAIVNAVGSFALGITVAVVDDPALATVIGGGFLGGLTTFSTWLVNALTAQRLTRDLVLHLGLGLPAALLGLLLGSLAGAR